MGELPAGTVTFLFTDVEGSTRLLRELGDEHRHSDDAFEEGLAEAARKSSTSSCSWHSPP